MSKPKKPRPNKYAEKVKLGTNLPDTLKIFADLANKKVKAKKP